MRTCLVLLIWLSASLVVMPAVSQPQTYHFDPEHTHIGFAIKFIGLVTVNGEFTAFDGSFVYDETAPLQSAVEVTIQAASIDTGVERRDNHLRSSDFFDVESHPEITFRSTRFEHDGERLVAVGPLAIHGLTKEIRLPFSITDEMLYPNTNAINRGVEATITLNRTDFAVGSDQAFLQVMENGSAWASEEVHVTLDVMWERRIPHVADLIAETIETEGVGAARRQFSALQAEYAGEAVYSFSTNAMKDAAQAFLDAGNVEAAIALYEMNVRIQPEWWWLYAPLAEAYETHGDMERAIATYEKLLVLNPEHEDSRAALKRLRRAGR